MKYPVFCQPDYCMVFTILFCLTESNDFDDFMAGFLCLACTSELSHLVIYGIIHVSTTCMIQWRIRFYFYIVFGSI